MKFAVDREKGIAALVLDHTSNSDLWERALRSGDTFPMPKVLQINLGIIIEGHSRIIPISALNDISVAAHQTLSLIGLELGMQSSHD